MSLIRRYLTGFRGVDTAETGLFEKDDGTSWYRKPDGSEVEIGGGGGSNPFGLKWCNFGVSGADDLSASHTTYAWSEANLSISGQDASNSFSVVNATDYGGHGGGILTAVDGWFQVLPYFSAPQGVTLDAGTTYQRWLQLAAVLGDQSGVDPLNDAFSGYGLDMWTPATNVANIQGQALTLPSGPGHAQAGQLALSNLRVYFAGAVGTDAITGAGVDGTLGSQLTLYQIA